MTDLPKTHTAQILADALRKCGLDDMANAAAIGHYHDYLSPLDLPELTLIGDLLDMAVIAKNNSKIDQYIAIIKLRLEVIEGKHDANREESDEWAKSPEGLHALKSLFPSRASRG